MRELISMWVVPTARRHGIAALLIDSVATWAETSGATALVLDVIATNAAAIALYEGNGFLRSGDEAVRHRAPSELRFVRLLG